jgi:hypothetical protein
MQKIRSAGNNTAHNGQKMDEYCNRELIQSCNIRPFLLFFHPNY